MRYTKRLLALLFVFALVAAACGGDDDTGGDDTVETTTSAAAPETTAAPETSDTTAPPDAGGDFVGTSVAAANCDYGGRVSSIEAVDELTVVFTLCSPQPAFQQIAAFTPFGIQPAEHLAATGGAPLDNPIGTGPFVLETWQRGDSIIYSANQDYWGDVPAFDTLVFRWATEGAARLLELQSGTVDQITNVSPDDFDTVKDDPNLQFLPVTNPNTLYLAMTSELAALVDGAENPDAEDTIFADVNVRKAIAMGIDRQRIVDNFYPEGSETASHFTPCSIPNGCEGEEWYAFDADAAKQALADAGFPDGFSTQLFYRDVFRGYLPEPSQVAVEFQTQLKQNLNIDAEIVVMESGEFIDESTGGRLDGLYLLGWGADYPHVTNFLDFHFGKSNPQFGAPHEDVWSLLEEGSTIADPATAAPVYEQANNAIRDLVPMVPIAHGASASAALATVDGAHFPPFGAPQFQFVNPGKDTFVFMQNAEPISLYCTDETDGESLAACQQVVEALLTYAQDSGEVLPALATGCTANEDATVWTCALRDGVAFHDGSAFDSNDVVASWAAGISAGDPLHTGNTGAFEYYSYLWDALIPGS